VTNNRASPIGTTENNLVGHQSHFVITTHGMGLLWIPTKSSIIYDAKIKCDWPPNPVGNHIKDNEPQAHNTLES
jgi:hypothetical protein